MHTHVLDLLRCPFCGTRLNLVENRALSRTGDDIESGVIGCECCAYPIVAGVPVMMADDRTQQAMHLLEAGEGRRALFLLLDLDEERGAAFGALLDGDEREITYRKALAILSVDAEGQYFIYRFSDPTFLVAQAVLRGLGSNAALTRRTIDVCGGSGHLTRVLGALAPGSETFLADVFFWKLWLARRFTAPECQPVCCDANQPLPFAADAFSMVVCSDAFPYIWQKRLLAGEMMRLAGPDGVVVMPHLHSALGENFTAGMTLTPAAYRDLLAPLKPRLFRDSLLFDQVVGGGPIDLAQDEAPERLAGEPALAVIASRRDDIFRRYSTGPLASAPVTGEVIVNPLYRIDVHGGQSILTLQFPTPEYEEEFAAAKRYLPARVIIDAVVTGGVSPESIGADYSTLRQQLVLIDAPARYY